MITTNFICTRSNDNTLNFEQGNAASFKFKPINKMTPYGHLTKFDALRVNRDRVMTSYYFAKEFESILLFL